MLHKVKITGPLSGTVEVDVPNYMARIQAIEELDITVKDAEAAGATKFEKAKKVFDYMKRCIKSVDLKTPEGARVDNFDDIGCFIEGKQVIEQLQTVCLQGIQLGEASKRQSGKRSSGRTTRKS